MAVRCWFLAEVVEEGGGGKGMMGRAVTGFLTGAGGREGIYQLVARLLPEGEAAGDGGYGRMITKPKTFTCIDVFFLHRFNAPQHLKQVMGRKMRPTKQKELKNLR